MIDRDVEERLDLRGVQVEGEDAIGAGGGDEVGHQLRRDRNARLVFPVLPGVAVVRKDRRDAAGRGALECVEHDQQLHQIVVHRRRRRLHDEDVGAADVLVDLDVVLAVRKAVERDSARLDPEQRTDLLGKRRMRSAGENLQRTVQGGAIIQIVPR